MHLADYDLMVGYTYRCGHWSLVFTAAAVVRFCGQGKHRFLEDKHTRPLHTRLLPDTAGLAQD